MFDHCFGDSASRDLTARPAPRYLFPAILPGPSVFRPSRRQLPGNCVRHSTDDSGFSLLLLYTRRSLCN
jgi:hypothetical protein